MQALHNDRFHAGSHCDSRLVAKRQDRLLWIILSLDVLPNASAYPRHRVLQIAVQMACSLHPRLILAPVYPQALLSHP
jgi:hypothetical protein